MVPTTPLGRLLPNHWIGPWEDKTSPGRWLRGARPSPRTVLGSVAMIEVYRPGFGSTDGHVPHHIPAQPGWLPDGDLRAGTDYRGISEFPEAQTGVSPTGCLH